MYQRTRQRIKLLAIIPIIYGGVELLLGMKSLWLTLQFMFYPSSDSLSKSLYYSSMIFFFKLMIPVGAILGGIGLFQQKRWGWALSVIVSLVVFTMNCAGAINFAIASYHFRNIDMPPIPEGAETGYYSMIPTYITTVVSLVFVLLLNRKSVKQFFKQMS